MLNSSNLKRTLHACSVTRTKRKEETGFAVVENGIIKEFKEKPIIEKLQNRIRDA